MISVASIARHLITFSFLEKKYNMKFRIKYQNKVKPINIFGDAKISQLISRCKDLFKPQT